MPKAKPDPKSIRGKVSLPKGVHARQANGKIYYSHQLHRNTSRAGPRTSIHFTPQDPEFWAICAQLNGEAASNPPGTVNALIARYQTSARYLNLKPNTQRDYDFYLRGIGNVFGERDVDELTAADVQAMYDALVVDTPVKAKKSIAVMRALYAFAVPRGLAARNPAVADFDLIRHKPQGAPPWPQWAFDVVDRHARWEVKTFVALALYTGQRTSDVVRMKPTDIAGNKLRVVTEKTGRQLWIPIHRELAPAILQCRQRGNRPFIHSPDGSAMSPDTFRALYDRQRTKPEFADFKPNRITPHGLRKCAVVKLREAAVEKEDIGLLVGMSPPMVEHYSKGWDQQQRVDEAVKLWEANG